MKKIKMISIYIIILFLIGLCSLYMWKLSRTINYAMSYESLVTETICKTVKNEYLVNNDICNN